MKIIFLKENKFNELFSIINENTYDEGGVFWVNNDNKNFDPSNLTANYEYLDDLNGDEKQNNYNKKIYVDYSKSNAFKKHPRNSTWVEVPWKSHKENSDKIESLDNDNPRDSKPNDDYVRGYNGKLYMPSRKSYNNGDNIKSLDGHKKNILKPDILHLNGGIDIKCFNLSMLGKNHATMMAHFYKGKDFELNKHARLSASVSNDGKNGNSIFNNFRNIRGYLNNMIKLVKGTKGLGDFDPDYIVYPQSSSQFNLEIARSLRKFVFINAKLKPNNWMYKEKIWGIDFESLAYLSKKEVSSYFKRYYSNEDSINEIAYNTSVKRFVEICSNSIIRKLKNIILDNKKQFSGKVLRERIIKTIINYIIDEYDEFSEGLKKVDLEMYSNKKEKNRTIVFVLNKIFSTNGVGKWGKGFSNRYNKQNNFAREQLFSSVDSVINSFINGDLSIDNRVLNVNLKNDTIKNYDTVGRLSIKNQFKIDNYNNGEVKYPYQDNSSIDDFSKFKFLIIDDNYASGASLRNASQLLINQGVIPENIICLTPGDMGGSGTGGSVAGNIAYNYGEGEFAHNAIRRSNFNDLSDDERRRINKVDKEYSKSPVHFKRNKINDFFNEKN